MADKKQATSTMEELRKLDVKTLNDKVAELKKELVENHKSLAAQELPNPRVIGKTRKQIAKIKTVIREKQSAQAEQEEEK